MTDYDEQIDNVNDQRNKIVELVQLGNVDLADLIKLDSALGVLDDFWKLQKAIEFIHEHTCHACLEESEYTFPQYDYRLCFDCSAIVIGEHLTDLCKINGKTNKEIEKCEIR